MNEPVDNTIAIGLNELNQRLCRPQLDRCRAEYQLWLRDPLVARTESPVLNWIEFLKIRIGHEISALEKLRRCHGQFQRSLKTSARSEDQKQVILTFAKEMGASPAELEKDTAAFARWFGVDAIKDRYHRRHASHEQYLAFLMDRLAALAENVSRNAHDSNEQMVFWQNLQLERVIKPLLAHDGDIRVELAAFRCLARVVSALSRALQDLSVDDTTLKYIYRSALQRQQNVWIQSAALELLVTLSWNSFERALPQRLHRRAPGDDLFVRRRAVQLLARHFHRLSCGEALISHVLSDPSPFVRQALPKVLVQAPLTTALLALEQMLARDASPQVRAATWLEWPDLLANPQFRDHAVSLFREIGRRETDDFVIRVICLVAERSTEQLRRNQDPFLANWKPAATEVLLALRCGAPGVKARRWASQSLEFVWSECHPKARALRDHMVALARTIPRGRSRRISAAVTAGLDAAVVGRVCSVVSRADYDMQLQMTRRGYKMFRGHVFGFRWWRWWHEFRHPSPDKRQAFSHTIGRLFDGELHIPSTIMAELAQTKVPGEPLHISAEGGWRPYLPLPDELTSAVELGRTTGEFRIFTSEGITTVTPPRGWKRWRALMALTWRFRLYAEKRNWLDSMQEPASSYIGALAELGFQIQFETYPDETGAALPADPMVLRFFPETSDARAEATSAAAGEEGDELVVPGRAEPVLQRLREQPDSPA